MRFVILGTGTALPDADRGSAGFAVQTPAGTWLVDGGSGTDQRAARAGIDVPTLRGGVYSHRHPDHTGGMVGVLFSMRHVRRATPYPLWGGEGLGAFVDAVRAAWDGAPYDDTPIHELPLDRVGVADLGDGLTLRTAPANHAAGALHLRFEHDGHAVVFSGDTGPSDALAELATGADLLVCECAQPDTTKDDRCHLAAEDVAAIVARARPGAVWLTHFYPNVDVDRALRTVGATGVPVRRAEDQDVWTPDS